MDKNLVEMNFGLQGLLDGWRMEDVSSLQGVARNVALN